MTLSDLRTRVQERIAAANGTPYTAAQIDAMLNEGQSVFVFVTLCIERTAERRLPADRPLWEMRQEVGDWLAPLRVKCRRYASIGGALLDEAELDTVLLDNPETVTSSVTLVRPARLNDLDALDEQWQLARGGTVAQYGCQGPDVFFIHPAPADTLSWLLLTYAAEPQVMEDDDHEAEIPGEDHPALVSYALAMLPLAYGGSELARFDGEYNVFLAAAARRAQAVRVRSFASRYDTVPAEIKLPDLSRKPNRERNPQ